VKTAPTHFDQFADSYDRALSEALAATGEDGKYFAQGRVNWLGKCLRRRGFSARFVMDYGCGVGSTAPMLLEGLGAESVLGLDVSARSVEIAQQTHGSEHLRFSTIQGYRPDGTCDLVYSHAVFHHIDPKDRGDALRIVFDSLRPGGLFAFWEHNPWNPGTRYVMAHCAFDGDAITLTAPEAKRLLRSAGFQVLQNDFLFIFPRALKLLRPAEKLVTKLPLGAQYLNLCRKPSSKGADSSRLATNHG
jgi:SAM-dependent methyltransferase